MASKFQHKIFYQFHWERKLRELFWENNFSCGQIQPWQRWLHGGGIYYVNAKPNAGWAWSRESLDYWWTLGTLAVQDHTLLESQPTVAWLGLYLRLPVMYKHTTLWIKTVSSDPCCVLASSCKTLIAETEKWFDTDRSKARESHFVTRQDSRQLAND